MGKHYGHIIMNSVLELKEQGLSLREIGEKTGHTKEQIKELLKGYRRNQRKLAAGIALKKRGRPAKGCIVTEEDKMADLRYRLSKKDYRIKQLEMENELLRDFLKEAGRS